MESWKELTRLSDADLAEVDPLVMNLSVAKGIPCLAHLDVGRYCGLTDEWTEDIRRRLLADEREFWKAPQDWENGLHQFRLGVLCYYLDVVLGIRYHEDQKFVQKICYTDPGDLFLNGVMDTRRGTCGNMAALHVALGWRLGWPVSLALAGWHCILRFDNGAVAWNVEASVTGKGGFHVHPDSYYCQAHDIAPEHVRSGSDLTFLRPQQLLGLFLGMRGRHWWDIQAIDQARQDFRLAVELYPQSRLFRRKVSDCDLYDACYNKKVTVSPWR
jgi:hypothetical protein